MNIQAVRTRVFKEYDDLFSFVTEYIKKVPEKSVIVITSKIVALTEGRTVSREKGKEFWIKKESDWAIKTKYTWLTVKDGMVMAAAGIDESNAKGRLILLPRDSSKSAAVLRKKLRKHYRVKDLGVLITDSRVFPLRAGVVGVALGYAGFKGIRDYRGKPDIFGKKLTMTQTDIADALATASVLSMGEGSEQYPLALITAPPIVFTDRINKKELRINILDDLYLPFFKKITSRK